MAKNMSIREKYALIGPKNTANMLGAFLFFLVFYIIIKAFGGFNYSKMAN